MAERQRQKMKPSRVPSDDRKALLFLLLAGIERYREVFQSDPPSEFVRIVAETREALGLFY